MSIAPGTRIGPYHVRSLVGTGGMGEVYRATDTRLHRDVAIKIMPAAVATDRARLDRFEQEARATAALNHPNIVVAFDTGTFEGAPYVVSELLEGETLRDYARRLAPLAARRVVECAQQIARGLAAAHNRGIVHRDLKPENIFVTREGHLKILDFGLAKLTAPEPAGEGAVLPTRVETSAGTVLGSNGYMAPEQIRGQDVDHRADIFTFGAVLYELLSGRRAFQRATPADTALAVLTEDPPSPTPHGADVPPGLIRIIERCLEKAPERRFQSASDLAFALEALSSPSGSAPAPVLRTARVRAAGLLLIGAVAVAIAGVLAAAVVERIRRQEPPEAAVVGRFAMGAPPGAQFTAVGGSASPTFNLSPDGRSVTFVASTDDQSAVWVRPLDALEPVRLPGTEGAVGTPFWSPDGSSIAFVTRSTLKAIELTSGSSRTICEGIPGLDSVDGTWSTTGTILIMGFRAGGTLCPAGGGASRPTSMWFNPAVPAAAMSSVVSHPQFLPDGRHFIFHARSASPEFNGILISAVGEDSRLDIPTQLLPDRSVASYAAGYLFFARDGVLMAQPFDPASRTLSGRPHPITRSVEFADARDARIGAAAGVVLYSTGLATQATFRWADASGTLSDTQTAPDSFGDFALSPEGTQLVVVRHEPGTASPRLWLVDLATGDRRPLGTGRDGAASSPVWSRDGRYVAYSRHTASRSSLAVAPPAGGAPDELLADATGAFAMDMPSFTAHDWSSNGLISFRGRGGGLSVVSPATGKRDPAPVPHLTNVSDSRFSSDGRWLAYASPQDGHVYVTPWPVGGQGSRVSLQAGAVEPRWSHDDQFLYYRVGNDLVQHSVSAGMPRGTPRVVVRRAFDRRMRGRAYGIAPDGRILLKQPVDREAPIIAIVNWRNALRGE